MRLQFKRRNGAVLILAGTLLASVAGSTWAQEISAAEKLLFLSNHFSNVSKPTKLSYTYRQVATPAPIVAPETAGAAAAGAAAVAAAFSDDVSVEVIKRNDDGTAAVAAHFLTGVHEIPIPSIDHAQGNPAILGFLERDIAEMKRLTGGATGYFRKRIRLALAAPVVPVKKIEVSYDGKQVAAQEVTIHPYRDDPLKDRFGTFADKGYVFVVSDAVPGSLYRVYTTLNSDKSATALDASMTIARGDAVAMKSVALVVGKK
jgi:hypothetical protein